MNIKPYIEKLVSVGIEKNEAEIEIKMLLEHFFKYSETDKLMGKFLSDNDLQILLKKVEERISTRLPIQYIIGEAYFMGEYFKVNQDVLIPRDETEILVREAIKLIQRYNYKNVLDIGTGSGCIACTIAKKTQAVVLGIDISSDALRVALDNVTRLGINNRAVFRKSDLFEKIREEEKFDLIISNPPYIPHGTTLMPEVRKEPEIALFAKENGLYFYNQIIKNAPKYLNPKGWILFEMGIEQSGDIKNFMSRDFKNIQIIKDLANIDRVILGQLK